MTGAYGRPYRRRKAAAFTPGVACSICGQPIRTRAEFTLHHTVPVSEGGNALSERPAHKTCNQRHGAQLGAQAARRRRPDPDDEWPDTQPPPTTTRRRDGRPGVTRVWEGAVAVPLLGPVEVHRPDGTVVHVKARHRYEP